MTAVHDASLAHEAAAQLLERHREIQQPQVFRLLGLDWDLLPGVYAPQLTESAALYAEWLPYPLGGSFCEIGCGTGYLAVLAALRGCTSVLAADVSRAAVENVRRNAERHDVGATVEAVESDLFAGLRDRRFDLVFWNSSFVNRDADAQPADDLEAAVFDPGYALHERFLGEAGDHLEPGGRLLLGFSSLGDTDRLAAAATTHGWELRRVRAAPSRASGGSIEYQLLEARRG